MDNCMKRHLGRRDEICHHKTGSATGDELLTRFMRARVPLLFLPILFLCTSLTIQQNGQDGIDDWKLRFADFVRAARGKASFRHASVEGLADTEDDRLRSALSSDEEEFSFPGLNLKPDMRPDPNEFVSLGNMDTSRFVLPAFPPESVQKPRVNRPIIAPISQPRPVPLAAAQEVPPRIYPTLTPPAPSFNSQFSSRPQPDSTQELTLLLQELINAKRWAERSNQKVIIKGQKTKKEKERSPNTSHTTTPLFLNTRPLPTTESPQWKPMNPNEKEEKVPEDMSEREWAEYVKKFSQQLNQLIGDLKKGKKQERGFEQQPKQRPIVTVIRNGSAQGVADRQYSFTATITLIRDGDVNILVDTGMSTDINGRTQLLQSLELQGVPPPRVDIVVSTHGHPDHAGNTQEFPDAVHYHGWFVHHRGLFNLTNLFEFDRHELTSSVTLLRVPGHTSEDIAVLVRDVEGMGNVAVAGDVFIRREDIENPREWMPLSSNEEAQAKARRVLICRSDSIIPGHGPPFRVSDDLRTLFHCAAAAAGGGAAA